MTIFIVRRTGNATVTSNNFDILRDASTGIGCEVVDNSSLKNALKVGRKDDIYIVTTAIDALLLSLKRRKNILYWSQGIAPEESYMYHRSKPRYNILSRIEKEALKRTKVCLFVSNAMKDHYENKYKIKINNFYIFPCFNTTICKEAFFETGKYDNNYFAYAGNLSLWQCFDETLQIYKSFEDLNLPNTKLLVLTKDKIKAEDKIKTLGIKNYEIGFTSKEELPTVLAKAKFGFVIRKYDPINVVSTPTKISTYLSCGLIPIYGDCIQSFKDVSNDMSYCVSWDDTDSCRSKVLSFMSGIIKADSIYNEYNKVFSSYFSYDYHVNNIKEIIKGITEQ